MAAPTGIESERTDHVHPLGCTRYIEPFSDWVCQRTFVTSAAMIRVFAPKPLQKEK